MCWPGRGRSSQTSGAPQQAPVPYTDWGLCGSRRWAAGSASSPSSAGSRRPPSPHPAAPRSGSGWTETCCPSAWGQRQVERKVRQVEGGVATVCVLRLTLTLGWPASDRCGCGRNSGSRLGACSRSVPRCHSAPPRWCPLKTETGNITFKGDANGLTDINKKGFLVVYLQESSDFTCNYWLSSFIERRWRDVRMTEKHEQRATQQLSNIKKHFTAELCFTEAETKELDSFSSRTKKIWQKHADFSLLH